MSPKKEVEPVTCSLLLFDYADIVWKFSKLKKINKESVLTMQRESHAYTQSIITIRELEISVSTLV